MPGCQGYGEIVLSHDGPTLGWQTNLRAVDAVLPGAAQEDGAQDRMMSLDVVVLFANDLGA